MKQNKKDYNKNKNYQRLKLKTNKRFKGLEKNSKENSNKMNKEDNSMNRKKFNKWRRLKIVK